MSLCQVRLHSVETQERKLQMAELGTATPERAQKSGSYANQWDRFVAWSHASGKRALPASPEDLAVYLEDRSRSGSQTLGPAGGGVRYSPQSQRRWLRRARQRG